MALVREVELFGLTHLFRKIIGTRTSPNNDLNITVQAASVVFGFRSRSNLRKFVIQKNWHELLLTHDACDGNAISRGFPG